VQTALSLRELGYTKPITIFNDEGNVPYQRPPLSKGFMMGKVGREGMRLRSPDQFDRAGISLVADRVEAIDRGVRRVIRKSGDHVEYEALVLATGSRNRTLDVPGSELEGVLSLRSLDDAEALQQRLKSARDVVIIGGGLIGLEFAAVASKSVARVHVVEAGPRTRARAVSPEVSTYFTRRHLERGTTFSFGDTVLGINGRAGQVVSVETATKGTLPADLVLVGRLGRLTPDTVRANGFDLKSFAAADLTNA
jgi:3-phenylpropionate/trans-cinnamate dioxygenase ferredoxin reductase subunit